MHQALTLSLPSSAAAPPGKIFSTLTSGCALEPFPPEMLIPGKKTKMARFLHTLRQQRLHGSFNIEYPVIWTIQLYTLKILHGCVQQNSTSTIFPSDVRVSDVRVSDVRVSDVRVRSFGMMRSSDPCHLGHDASKEPKNPFYANIHRFL